MKTINLLSIYPNTISLVTLFGKYFEILVEVAQYIYALCFIWVLKKVVVLALILHWKKKETEP